MEIQVYTSILDDDRKEMLVKEKSVDYPGLEKATNPEKIVKIMNDLFTANRLPGEHVWLMAMDTQLQLQGIFEVGHGCYNSSVVSPRDIFIKLLLLNATRFAVVHNHPSGISRPSQQDIEITKKLKDGGKLLDVIFIDHVIIGKTNEDYCSLREEGFFD